MQYLLALSAACLSAGSCVFVHSHVNNSDSGDIYKHSIGKGQAIYFQFPCLICDL